MSSSPSRSLAPEEPLTREAGTPLALAPAARAAPPGSLLPRRVRALVHNGPTLAGAIVVALLVLAALAPGLFTGADPYELSGELRFLAPSAAHWFGTDELGRDLFARVVHGTRISLRAALVVVALAATIGVLLGGIAAFFSRILDEVVMRVVDILIGFPPLIMAMAIVTALGPGLEQAALALAVIWWPQYARLARSLVLGASQALYVEAATASGAGRWRIFFRHILPGCWGPVLVKGTLDIGYAILLTAALSFIGLGAKPPTPEWGALITTGRQYLLDYWWYATFPGLAIFLAVMGFNLIGDGLRDVLDPQE
jgi:peptide/nickel transport system permease protein